MSTGSHRPFTGNSGPIARLLALMAWWFCCSPAILADATSIDPGSLKGMFLVARDGIQDSRFRHSVLLVTRHNNDGAIALMINHPTRIPIAQLLPDIPELQGRSETAFIGGPLTNVPLIVLVENPPVQHQSSAVRVLENIFFTMDYTMIPESLDKTGTQLRLFIGLASWGPGQLEAELRDKVWHLRPGDTKSVFSDSPSLLWEKLSDPRNNFNWVFDTPISTQATHSAAI